MIVYICTVCSRKKKKTQQSPAISRKIHMAGFIKTGADPGFSNRGGAKDYVHAAHIPTAKCEVLYGRGPCRGGGALTYNDSIGMCGP